MVVPEIGVMRGIHHQSSYFHIGHGQHDVIMICGERILYLYVQNGENESKKKAER